VSTVNSADAPTVLAARREMQSWRRLALEPTALRAADRFVDPSAIGSDGRDVAAALFRIAHDSPHGPPEDVYARISNRVAGLAGVDIREIRVDEDAVRQLLSIVVIDGSGRELPARSLSEGTLRYLALCVLLEDPTVIGLISMEEPENGIHPANVSQIVDLVCELAVDPDAQPGFDNPLRQVIVNTHSPAVVALIGDADLLYARQVEVADAHGQRRKSLRLLGMQGTWRDNVDARVATKADLLPYLSAAPGAQIRLFDVA
jgi:predicted ATPase